MKLIDFIDKYHDGNVAKAARELGVTRQHLNDVAKKIPAGPKLARKIEKWSKNKVSFLEAVRYSDLN